MKPVIYVVANKGLDMTPGKIAAQVGHAVAGLMVRQHALQDNFAKDWLQFPHRWMIVLEAEDEIQLNNLACYLAERSVPYYTVIDEGVNEIRPFSLTALAVGPLEKGGEEAACLSGLKKYSDDRNHAGEAERADLESQCTCKGTGGSNPPDSA